MIEGAVCCAQADRGLAEVDKLLPFLLSAFPSSTGVWWEGLPSRMLFDRQDLARFPVATAAEE